MRTVRPPLTLGFEPARFGVCTCCGGKATNLVRFVFRDGVPYAVYYATFTENHPEAGVQALVSLGDWSAEGTPERRTAFALRLLSSPGGYQAELVDAGESPWRTATLVGRLLRRDEAEVHPRVREALRIADEMAAQDPEVRGYLGLHPPTGAAVPEA